jgi:organic radical activating enzyme
MAITRVSLEIHPSKTCNRHCGFCGFDSKMGEEMFLSGQMAETLSAEIREVPLEFWFNISGGGEPFMNPELPGIIRHLSRCENAGNIDLITSGQLSTDYAEIARRKAILLSPAMKKLSFCLSLNEYNPTGEERFGNTLEALLFSKRISRAISILLRFSQEKTFTTWNLFAKIAAEVEEKLEEFGRFDIFSLNYNQQYLKRAVRADHFTKLDYSRRYAGFIQRHALLFGAVIRFASDTRGDKIIVTNPMSLIKMGRAKNLKETCLYPFAVPAEKPPGINWVEILLGYDGYYYPSVNCYYNPVMRLGRVGEDHLSEIVRKKMRLLEVAPDNILATTNVRDGKCELCQRKKIELFGL